MKIYSTSYVIKEIKIRTTMGCHHTLIRTAKIWDTDNTKCWREHGTPGTLHYSWQKCQMVQPLWKKLAVPYKTKNTLPYDSAIYSLVFTQRNWKLIMSTQKPAIDVYITIIDKGKNLEAIKIHFSVWIDSILSSPERNFWHLLEYKRGLLLKACISIWFLFVTE